MIVASWSLYPDCLLDWAFGGKSGGRGHVGSRVDEVLKVVLVVVVTSVPGVLAVAIVVVD